MVKLINLTPHAINLNDGSVVEPSGNLARVSSSYTEFDENLVSQVTFGEITGLPPAEDGVLYIVSALVASAGKSIGREDLVAPATGHPQCIRNEKGLIMSVPGFVKG